MSGYSIDNYHFVFATQVWDSIIHSKTVTEKNTKTVEKTEYRKTKEEFPLWHKITLTLEEAAVYSGIGIHKLRELTDDENCSFVLWNGNKRLIKRKQLDEYIEKVYSI